MSPHLSVNCADDLPELCNDPRCEHPAHLPGEDDLMTLADIVLATDQEEH